MRRVILTSGLLFVATVLGLTVGGIFYQPNISIPPGLEGKYIDIRGNQIRFIQKGQGPDILLIHGCPGSLEDWASVIDPLSKNFRVTAYDRPGHGYSDSINSKFTIESNARLAYELIGTLNLKDVIVVGHSYGGLTALALAVHNPVFIKSFVLLGAPSYKINDISFLYYFLRIPLFGKGLSMALSPIVSPYMIRNGILESFSPNEKSIPDSFINDRVKIWGQTKVITTISKEILKLNKSLKKLSEKYSKVNKTTYIVYGKEDQTSIIEDSQKLHKTIENSKLLSLKKTGHFIQYARPKTLIRLLKKVSSKE